MELQPLQEEVHRVKIPPTTYQPIFCHQDLKVRHNSLLKNLFKNACPFNCCIETVTSSSFTQCQSTEAISLNNSVALLKGGLSHSTSLFMRIWNKFRLTCSNVLNTVLHYVPEYKVLCITDMTHFQLEPFNVVNFVMNLWQFHLTLFFVTPQNWQHTYLRVLRLRMPRIIKLWSCGMWQHTIW